MVTGRQQRTKVGAVVAFVVSACCCLAAAYLSETMRVNLGARPAVAGEVSVGPDVFLLNIPNAANYESEQPNPTADLIDAFSFGTTSCNAGDQAINWVASTPAHPVIRQGMYRLLNGRFEQIGTSWVKHGFLALNNASNCGSTCQTSGSGAELRPGCSDPYSATLNGVRSYLGPSSPVNAHTGVNLYPHEEFSGPGTIGARLQVHHADLDPVANEGAKYFAEGHYVAQDDAQAGNGNNNASYRQAHVGFGPGTTYTVALDAEGTRVGESAIWAWKEHDPLVTVTEVQIPGEGLFLLAARAIDTGTGSFHYEYALQNLNSDRSGGSFSVPLPEAVFVQNVGFHDVDYHSGEPWDLTDWTPSVQSGRILWSTQTYDENPEANALRWSTLYNFRFDANVGPETATVTLGLFKPGALTEVAIQTIGPSPGGLIDCNQNEITDICDVDCDASGCGPPCGESDDCNFNMVPDECEPDCNENGTIDICDIVEGKSPDCNANTVPDECEPDCDHDGIPDPCEEVPDTDGDGVLDCFDRCPVTTPPNGCVSPTLVTCRFQSAFCIYEYPRLSCLDQGGTPVCGDTLDCFFLNPCVDSRCREGCMIGDGDDDGDIDLWDYAGLQACYTGPFDGPAFVIPSADCLRGFDFDGDTDIDLSDFDEFRTLLAGP